MGRFSYTAERLAVRVAGSPASAVTVSTSSTHNDVNGLLQVGLVEVRDRRVDRTIGLREAASGTCPSKSFAAAFR